jgi:hypothetical protein
MGIKVEFNPDLALRNISQFYSGARREEECIPKNLSGGQVYSFLKEGQRNYWLEGKLPLLETDGFQNLSQPLASILIIEATHFLEDGKVYTRGKYRVIQKFDDEKIHFNGFSKI